MARARFRFVWRQVLHDLGSSLLVRPALVTTLLATLAVLLIELDLPVPRAHGLAWVFAVEPSSAQAVLGAIAGSMMAVVSIVYSVLLMALSLASMQFSPRILGGFMKDKVSQTTLGVFIGTFVFCLLILRAITTSPAYVPAYGVSVAMLLAMVALGWLVYFIHHIATGIQANRIVDRIARETRVALGEVPAAPAARGEVAVAAPRCGTGSASAKADLAGYVQLLDDAGLVALGRRADVVIHVVTMPGDFVARGGVLARVDPADRATPEVLAEVLAEVVGAFDVGPVRTLQQDYLYGVRQIVDIALKAISPAVNDPSTAATCIDHLGSLLAELCERPDPSPVLTDSAGAVRVVLRPPGFADALELALKQLRQYGRGDMAVAVRLLGALTCAAERTDDPARLGRIASQAERLRADLSPHFQLDDRATFDARLAALVSRCEPPAAA